MKTTLRSRGFTLVEMTFGLVLLGIVLLAFAAIMSVIQKSSASTTQYADAQQNARAALDYITENLRAAGSDVEAYDGQGTIVYADPYQVVFNGDFDRGKVIQGQQPLAAIDIGQSPSTYPSGGGAVLYAPPRTFNTGAETIVFTLDSNQDGTVTTADRGDDAEENTVNPHLYLLKRYEIGYQSGASNVVRDQGVALVRGPVNYPNGNPPPPLFEYYYNDDNDVTTPDKLWGDDNPTDGKIAGPEITALTAVPDSLVGTIRRVKVNVVSEALTHGDKHQDNDGFAQVSMSSQVYIRNVDIHESCLVTGTVYYDANASAKRDQSEPGIPSVAVRLQGSGRSTITDQFGRYSIPVGPGDYTLVETDPSGYTSSTPNTVALTLSPGEKRLVDFGDNAAYQFGYVFGHVFTDDNKNGVRDMGEAPLGGVTVQASNGMSARTNDQGYYRLTLPVGSYKISETDLAGYASTTPNAVSVSLASQGDSTVVNYGDIVGNAYGTLQGYVFLDSDQDGQRDFGEAGIENVKLTLSNNDVTTTDAAGHYQFQLDPGKYDIYELDQDNMTSSTPNLVKNVVIQADSTVTVNFGDMPVKNLNFIEIFVGDTDRPLSVSAADMGEDANKDPDIVLGTPTSTGPGNVFIYENKWQSGANLSTLFDTTPNYVRNAKYNVNALATWDFNGDQREDILTGVDNRTGNNLMIWMNDSTGTVANSPAIAWQSGYGAVVTVVKLVDLNKDGYMDMVVGHKITDNTGSFEVLVGYGGGSFFPAQLISTGGGGQALGAVTGLDVADLDGDGNLDIVVASNTGPNWGGFDVYHCDYAGYSYSWNQHFIAKGGVHQINAVPLYDKIGGGTDILVGVTESPGAGGMHVWLNHGKGTFGVPDTTSYVFDQYTTPHQPDEYVHAGGEGLVVMSTNMDGDIYPDILLGTRSSLFYTGDLFLIRRTANGTSVSSVKVNISGEVVAVGVADFNKDGQPDIVTTTRTGPSSGKLAVYFMDPNAL